MQGKVVVRTHLLRLSWVLKHVARQIYVKEKAEVHMVMESQMSPHTQWKLNVQMKLRPQATGVWKPVANAREAGEGVISHPNG